MDVCVCFVFFAGYSQKYLLLCIECNKCLFVQQHTIVIVSMFSLQDQSDRDRLTSLVNGYLSVGRWSSLGEFLMVLDGWKIFFPIQRSLDRSSIRPVKVLL